MLRERYSNMLWLKKTVLLCTKKLNIPLKRRIKGEVSMYIYALWIIFFLAVILKMNFDERRMYITYDAVDDSIVTALTAATAFNVEEYGLSGQAVIFDTVTELKPVEIPLPGVTPPPPLDDDALDAKEMEDALEFLNSDALLSPLDNGFLQSSYNDFMRALKRNLKLDDSMNSSLSGIEGIVSVDEFSIYNRFEQYGRNGNLLAYRIIKYTYDGSFWNVYPYNIDTPVSIYNSYDKSDSSVDTTAVTASLTFDLRLSDYMQGYMPGLTEDDMTKTVNYQRIVDIKKD